MATLKSSDIITRAYRENNLIPVGKTPTDAEVTEALGVYQDLLTSLIGIDIGQLFNDWELPPSPTSQNPSRWPLYPQQLNQDNQQQVWRNPPPNVNLIANSGIGDPVYFPPTPPNGARMSIINVGADLTTNPLTLDGNGRLIEGASAVTIEATDVLPIMWFYRAELANWVRVTPIALDSDSPLPDSFNNFLIASLNILLCPRNGKEPATVTQATANHGHRLLKTTYLQTNPGATFPGAWRFNTYQSYGTPWRFGGPGGGFG